MLTENWVSGTHVIEYDGEGLLVKISSAYSTFACGEFFAQGEDADKIIQEIHRDWYVTENISMCQAVKNWVCNNLTPEMIQTFK